jgi:hypothetical protein
MLYYRQHETNVIGAKGGRVRMMLGGTYVGWIRANHEALWQYRDHLTSAARTTLRVCLPLRAGLNLTNQ